MLSPDQIKNMPEYLNCISQLMSRICDMYFDFMKRVTKNRRFRAGELYIYVSSVVQQDFIPFKNQFIMFYFCPLTSLLPRTCIMIEQCQTRKVKNLAVRDKLDRAECTVT